MCTGVDPNEWLECSDGMRRLTAPMPSGSSGQAPATPGGSRRRRVYPDAEFPTVEAWRLEELTEELFHLHDLNSNGVLEEEELISLNQKIAVMHHGADTDVREVRAKYRTLFRSRFDPDGRPVPYQTFRVYAQEVLDGLDSDPEAQEMILEQFVAEAYAGREALGIPSSIRPVRIRSSATSSGRAPPLVSPPKPRGGDEGREAAIEFRVRCPGTCSSNSI